MTAGPWKAVPFHGEGRSILAVMANGPTQVAVMTEGDADDARLMAVAPEAVHALAMMLEHYGNPTDTVCRYARAVLGKARGR